VILLFFTAFRLMQNYLLPQSDAGWQRINWLDKLMN
jgi:hypothetical protein